MPAKTKPQAAPVPAAPQPVPQPAPQPAQDSFSIIPNQKLLELYRAMLKCRGIDERAAFLFKQGNFRGSYTLLAGGEAAAVGAAIDLAREDTLVPMRSCSIPSFLRGAPLDRLFARLGNAGASCGTSRRLHFAVGVALASKTRKNNKIVLVFWSGERIPPGRWNEALNVAATHALPIVFVRQDKLRGDVDEKPQPCGVPSITVDGNDIVAVYRVAAESIARARQGRGPTLIECVTWKAGDPIANMEEYLGRKGLFNQDWKAEAVAAIDRELDAAIAAAGLPRPSSC